MPLSDGYHHTRISDRIMGLLALCTVAASGGATALIACSSATMAPWFGFQFVVTVLVGSIIMMLIALVVNNLPTDRVYPTYWI